ncbi:hypothetical protein B9T31_05405 [Acinetobacter sp. ANC 4558]|uniref:trans-sulfuration enzyme family protein n=1 Tax=Acinetobacter sp. ANC 4558 TaxID=1977876 RepID=UPI000A348B11|nr:aminotransferase class I/II-fold pyridoxal phosphate-dependent enzyme [Acinetobacter sp. ANC 4558]OTG87045.1 hypothetical protein B9T31_05405 [Acinetobacter sp. ANC 4558]
MTLNHLTSMLHANRESLDDCHSDPIAMTAAYDFDTAFDASERFNNRTQGNIYSRFTNPSVRLFENKVALLEGADDALAFSSGMSAYLALAICFLKNGDHILVADGIFGTTTSLFKNFLIKFGVEVSTFEISEDLRISNHIKQNTKMIFVESPTNPILQIIDIAKVSKIAKEKNIIFIVDNTLLTPIFQKPLAFGATLSLHSAGKFFDGQGRCVGGVIAGEQSHIDQLRVYLRHTGTCLSPFNAWLLSSSIDTLESRMLTHQRITHKVYEWLSNHPYVNKIYSTFSSTHTNSEIVKKQQTGHTPIISFEINGDMNTAWKIIDNLKLITNCTNIGGSRSMVTHPSSTTHCKYSEEERMKVGISQNLIRLCIGLENEVDLINDLDQAINQAVKMQKHLLLTQVM